jgi:GlcNAc-P-P-Und epimerase
LPYWFGLMLGYCADFVAWLSGRTLPVSSIRVKKFASASEFVSSKENLDEFSPPFELLEGVQRTIESEFLNPDPSREVFYTE